MKEMERSQKGGWAEWPPQQTALSPQECTGSKTGLQGGPRISAWSLTTDDPNGATVPKQWQQKTNCSAVRSKYSETKTPPSRSFMVMVKNEINLKETEEAEEFCFG